ncbi:hypothetical protein PIB30_068645, partial [Stylosanthes scabra]|nr:hypothetical protein [Stylosanthes scabra]
LYQWNPFSHSIIDVGSTKKSRESERRRRRRYKKKNNNKASQEPHHEDKTAEESDDTKENTDLKQIELKQGFKSRIEENAI